MERQRFGGDRRASQAAVCFLMTLGVAALAVIASRAAIATSCPAFTAGNSCTDDGTNDCSGESCLYATQKAYCIDGDQIESQKIVNATTPWPRCQQRTGAGSCSEYMDSCGTVKNYKVAPVETGACQDEDYCDANVTRVACKTHVGDPCGSGTGTGS